MDSDDSHDGSSGNDSDQNVDVRSSPISRSPSPNSAVISPPDSPNSAHSRSFSPEDGPQSPHSSPKSPESGTEHSDPASLNNAPISPNSSVSSSPRVDDRQSPTKSASSNSSKSLDRLSRTSSQGYRNNSANVDGNTSDSSAVSVDSSSRKNKTINKDLDTQPEEISDEDMESDHDKQPEKIENKKSKSPIREINISHEDLSDVSDLDESIGGHSDDGKNEEIMVNVNGKTKLNGNSPKKVDKNRPEDGEEQLDFEAEDGECEEPSKEKDDKAESVFEDGEMGDNKEKDELEEGEVSDEDDVRPEETEPRPVCRFFSRGQCTWGASCRFLHPGVTDKGNYTMFELIRPVVPGEYGREDRVYSRPEPAPIESAWERGLRTAKEMLRKSIKRKEQDIDFEEKKMNLSLAQEEFDKENGYYGRVPSPEPRYVRHVPVDYPPVVRAPPPPAEEYYGRRQVIYEPDYVPSRERVRSYRELPSHRMPDYYNSKYEDEPPAAAVKVRKPKREVIVQRAEERPVRGDEWSDPWMRSKSPVGRKAATAGRKRSYSSASSYSSSSGSSHSSSDSSHSSGRSRSRSHNKRRAASHRSRHVSPSVIVSERKAANERAALMNPPAPRKRATSPSMMRVGAANPPPPSSKEDQFGRRSKLAAALARVKGRRRSSKSSSDSSGSSSSDSDSSVSSSSSSRDGSPSRRSGAEMVVKAMDALKGNASEKRQIKLNLKNPTRKPEICDLARKAEALQGKKRPAPSSPPPSTQLSALDPKSKKATSRREELLKQLKAVEDAIAKKRSKVN